MSKFYKIKKRFSPILANVAQHIIPILFQALFSLYIIRSSSPEIWGDVVKIIVWINLILTTINWGSKEFLLRSFSKNPANYISIWKDAFKARIILLLPAVLLLIYFFPDLSFFLLLWLVGLFIARSYDVLFIFKTKFSITFYRDLIIYSSVFLYFLINQSFKLELIFSIFAIIAILQAVFNSLYFRRKHLLQMPICIVYDKSFLMSALPFLFISLSGLLQSRADIYMVSILLDSPATAKYQIYTNFLSLWLSLIYMTLVPFLKHLYRLKDSSIHLLQKKFVLLNSFISIFFLFLLQQILTYLYGFNFSLFFWVLAFISLLSIFFNIIETQKIYRLKGEKFIILVSLVIGLISVLMNYYILPIYKIDGAIAVTTISNILLAVVYSKVSVHLLKKEKHHYSL